MVHFKPTKLLQRFEELIELQRLGEEARHSGPPAHRREGQKMTSQRLLFDSREYPAHGCFIGVHCDSARPVTS
jgi:hypothetical protein